MPGIESLRRVMPALVVATLAATAVGCSADRSVFESTPFRPARVEVVDTMAGETVWAMNVPVNHKLVVDLDHEDKGRLEGFRPARDSAQRLEWLLYPADARQRMTSGYYWGSPLDRGTVELDAAAVMLHYKILPRDRAATSDSADDPSEAPDASETQADDGDDA